MRRARYGGDPNLRGGGNNAVFNALPFHLQTTEAQSQPFFMEKVKNSKIYPEMKDNLSLVYSKVVDTSENNEDINMYNKSLQINQMNDKINEILSGSPELLPITIDVDDLTQIMRNEDGSDKSGQEFLSSLKDYISLYKGVEPARIKFKSKESKQLRYWYNIFKAQYAEEMEVANQSVEEIGRSRYNIKQFPLYISTINDQEFLEWIILSAIPLVNKRQMHNLPETTQRLINGIRKLGIHYKSTFHVVAISFFIYKRPFNLNQNFDLNKLLTSSASLVSPIFASGNFSMAKKWVQKLSKWYDDNGENITDNQFREQFYLDISTKDKSYIRNEELFQMMEKLYRNESINSSFIFVISMHVKCNLAEKKRAGNVKTVLSSI
ncbi:MAG: hypothetical protein ACRC0V_00765 [Fusobacteriaceae bacterium]